MAEDDQVHGRLPDELAQRLGQAPLSEARQPGSGRRKSLSPLPSRNGVCTSRMRCHGGRGQLLSELAPFMNLLPAEIILADMKEQELLRSILLDVGRHAYCHLVKYLKARPGPLILGSTLNDFIPPPPNQLSSEQMIMLAECLDDAVDSIRDVANDPNFKDSSLLLVASRETIPESIRGAVCVEMITPEMAATALTLLVATAFRRPQTRIIENLMSTNQDEQTNGIDGDSQREGTETLDESVPPPPTSDDSLLGLACSTGLWELAMVMVRVRQSCDFMAETECTPLMEACAAGHAKIVRQMIPYSVDLNAQSVTQNSALIYASAGGHVECVEALLEEGPTFGIDINLKNENGHCALMEAASGGHLKIVQKLIEAGSSSLRMNVNSEFKESPLTLAAYKGHEELVEYLLTLDLGETREEELHTALMEASMDGYIQVVETLLKAGAPVNLPSDSFESPLTLAACGGHTRLVRLLISAGANIEEPNDESYTPLMEAAREGHEDVVRLLLDAGALVNRITEETGETAMTLAACQGFTDIVEMILDAGGDLEAGANTPLQEAATEGHQHTTVGIIRMMKERGHDKDLERLPKIIQHASSALVQAADNGHYKIVREIATSGFVDVNFQTEDHRTAMMKAAKGGYRDIIRYLVSAGADVNTRSASGDVTALSLACAGGHYDTVVELLQHNADPNVVLKDGVTCVLEAARHGYVHIVELLLDFRGGAGGQTGPKPNRKVATPRRTVTAARKAASTTTTPSVAAETAASLSKAAKAQLAAAQAALAASTAAVVKPPCSPVAAATTTAAPASPAAPVPAAAAAADAASASSQSNAAAMAAAREACMKTKDPGAHASDMMKTMAYSIQMPSKEQSLPQAQLESFHRFHNFLVRTAKGENPPPLSLASVIPSSGTVPDAQTLAALAAFDAAATLAVAAATAEGSPTSTTSTDASMSPSPCPSSPTSPTPPSLLPLMTASSDEFVSDQRAPVQVKRRSASVPHDRSNPRWPSESMIRLHEEHIMAQAAATAAAAAPVAAPQPTAEAQQQTAAKGDAAPPPSKRATGPNRQGATRTGTVEKRPLAATSTFDVDMQTESNNDTPLTLACSNGHTAMVELLVQRGANVHHRDKKGFTPLILAATGGHLEIVQSLLDHGANIETQSERTKDTALSLACSGGKKDVADLLLKRGANKEHRNVSDYTPLSLAASGGYVDICNMLLDAGAEINSRTGSKLGISPLMLAAMNGHKDATRVLLERGSDINAQIETNRNTALTLACFQGRTEVVRLLLQYNANVEHRAKTGLTPLMEAANGGYVEVGQLLLEAFADPNTSPVPTSRDTALTIAADKGHEKFVELLIKNGAVVDARNKKGCTALWLACHGGHLETVQTLVKHKKTNVEMEDNRKVSPLMVAFRKGHTKIVKFLVKWVSQFPGDAELSRFIQTVTEQDLMTRCHECMNTIVTAKDKQAAQANLAADALIAQIEAEEEQARSKKLSKQRQKEKKKAKKQEKKKQEESDDEDEEVNVVDEIAEQAAKEEAARKAEAAAKLAEAKTKAPTKQAAAPTPLAAAAAAKGKARAAAAVAARVPVDTTPERETEKVEERIPGMNLVPPSPPTQTAPVAAPEAVQSARKSTADRRAANRRNRNESGKTPSSVHPLPSLMSYPLPASVAQTAALSSLQQLRSPPAVQQVVLSPLASPRGTASSQEEWVKANKKGRNVRNDKAGVGAASATPAGRSSSAAEKQKLTDPTDESALALWNNIEASRRRQITLTVSSPCIARVIGRGGANINAIREATGASIEVERQADKALARRDMDREICIRGTAETVKNAVAMINGLIAETDVTVNEIIRLVRNSSSPSEQPRHVPDAYAGKMATTAAAAPGGGAASRSATAASVAPSSTTNVWQQRLAARQVQDAALRPQQPAAPVAVPVAATTPAPVATPVTVQQRAPAHTTSSTASSPTSRTEEVDACEVDEKEEQQQQTARQEEEERKAAEHAAAVELLQRQQQQQQLEPQPTPEEQQRKAPGFARPLVAPIGPPPPSSATTTATPPTDTARTPASPHARPTALPTTPLLHDDRVPNLAQHVLSFGEDEEETTTPEGAAPSLAKQDSASAIFDDSTLRSIAKFWGDADATTDLNSSSRTGGRPFGGAWDNALLLNSFNNISLSKSDWGEYSAPLTSVDNSSSLAFSAAPSSAHNLQQHHSSSTSSTTAAMPSASAAFGHASADPFAASGPRNGPLFARGSNATSAGAARTAPVAPKPQPPQSGGNVLDSIFNNVAAALIHHQTAATTTTSSSTISQTTSSSGGGSAASNYYPSPSYTDPAAMGLGSLKNYGAGGLGGVASGSSNGASAYQQQAGFGRVPQSAMLQQQLAAAQQVASMRMGGGAANGYPPAPPPGFNQINPALSTPAALAASRTAATSAYFGGQMPPQPGTANSGAFHPYAQNGWPTNGGMPPKQPAPPTLNGSATGRGGSSFYSNGWN